MTITWNGGDPAGRAGPQEAAPRELSESLFQLDSLLHRLPNLSWKLRAWYFVHGGKTTGWLVCLMCILEGCQAVRSPDIYAFSKCIQDLAVGISLLRTTQFAVRHGADLRCCLRDLVHLTVCLEVIAKPEQLRYLRATVLTWQRCSALVVLGASLMAINFSLTFFVTGESASPLLGQEFPGVLRATVHFLQAVSISRALMDLFSIAALHLSCNLSYSSLFQVLGERFRDARGWPELRHLLVIHVRMLTAGRQLQELLAGIWFMNLLMVLVCVVVSAVGSIRGFAELYMFLIDPILMSYMLAMCLVGDRLHYSSTAVAGGLYSGSWLEEGPEFRKAVALAIARAHRPQVMFAKHIGVVNKPTFITFLNSWYKMVQVLLNA